MKKETQTPIVLAGIIILFCVVLFLTSGSEEIIPETLLLLKNEPGEGDHKIVYSAKVANTPVGELDITIPERHYSEEEVVELFRKCRREIVKNLIGSNTDLTEITDDLVFSPTLEGYPFTFSYVCDKKGYIGKNGEIITDKPFTAVIAVNASYEEFADTISVKMNIVPGEKVRARVYKNELLAKLEDYEDETSGEVLLPTEVNGKAVEYGVPGKKRNPVYLILGAAASVAVFIGSRVDRKKEREKRKETFLEEYPVILQKMSLYLSAGMTIRNIWVLIYEEGKKTKTNPIYEEMGISVNELQGGVSEGVVYTRFGERTEVPELVRFTALLSQNLKKGSSRLKELLKEEVSSAYLQKKQLAIKKGEEAGTGLLFPMMLLLMDVLIMIMVPAFWSL